jgi:hypothetical protein
LSLAHVSSIDSEQIRVPLLIEFCRRNGDSALWTGMYLGAEAYRYAVTADPTVRANMPIFSGSGRRSR